MTPALYHVSRRYKPDTACERILEYPYNIDTSATFSHIRNRLRDIIQSLRAMDWRYAQHLRSLLFS